MHAWFTKITKRDLSSVLNGKSDKTYWLHEIEVTMGSEIKGSRNFNGNFKSFFFQKKKEQHLFVFYDFVNFFW